MPTSAPAAPSAALSAASVLWGAAGLLARRARGK
jgi:hypothetical protein